MIDSILKVKSIKYFLLLVGFTFLISMGISYSSLPESIYYQSLGERLNTDQITSMIESLKKWQWLGYLFIPLVILIRVGFSSTCLYTGMFIANIKVRFQDLFKVALIADFVFVLAGVVKLIILIFIKEVNTLDDLQFQPLSLMELFNRESVDQLFFYPLSLISIFEALYWLVLAWLLMDVVEKPFGSTLKTVASSYGTGLLLWVLFVMFLTVNLS